MPEVVDVAISDLLLDQANARLGAEQSTQQDVFTELASNQGRRLVSLAEDIVKNGLDPTTLIAIIPTGDRLKRYRVIEGNRRVLALKALETPSLVTHALPRPEHQRLLKLSTKYLEHPLTTVPCVLFDTEDEALHWVELRHTGVNDGAGLVGWDANEQDRFRLRHTGARRPAGQILDFVEKHGDLSEQAKQSRVGVLSNIERFLVGRDGRDALGIDVVGKEVVSYYPMPEVLKGLTRVVEDFKCERANVHDVYFKKDRAEYASKLPKAHRPKGKRLPEPTTLETLAAGKTTPAAKTGRRRRPKPKPERTTVIPGTSGLNINQPRINKIYNELTSLSAETYPNACSVLLRVFVELSTDHVLDAEKLMTPALVNGPLAKRLTALAGHLRRKGQISESVKRAIDVVASRKTGPLAASTTTMNQYVHNPHVHPTAAELRAAWDELQPFMEKVWP